MASVVSNDGNNRGSSFICIWEFSVVAMATAYKNGMNLYIKSKEVFNIHVDALRCVDCE